MTKYTLKIPETENTDESQYGKYEKGELICLFSPQNKKTSFIYRLLQLSKVSRKTFWQSNYTDISQYTVAYCERTK